MTREQLEEVFKLLYEDFGLDTLLEQNDIDPVDLLIRLYEEGLIDLEDYIFEDIEELGEDD